MRIVSWKSFLTVTMIAGLVQIAPSMARADDATMSESEVLSAIGDLGSDVAEDMGRAIEKVFAETGQKPTAVIVGNEGSGAVIVGYRKGAGSFRAKGQSASDAKAINWRAPSIGFNVGGSASKVAILVYGTTDYDKLLQKFVSLQGSLHVIAGASISYLRSDLDTNDPDAIGLAYVTVGVGLDAGVSVETLSFSKDERWIPDLF